MEARHSLLKITLAPLADHLPTEADSLSDDAIRHAFCCKQNDTRSPHQTVGQGPGIHDGAQLLAFHIRQNHGLLRPAGLHGFSPPLRQIAHDTTARDTYSTYL